MKEHEKLTENTLFLACTRPAMIAGVTVEAMGLNGIRLMILFIMAGNIFLLTIGVAIHFIFKEILKHDHNKFRILLTWQKQVFLPKILVYGVGEVFLHYD